MPPSTRLLLFSTIGAYFVQQMVPLVANALVFVPWLVWMRPWSVVTYMFLHGGLMHLAFNMIALFFFGPQVEARLGSRRFTILYFVSGIAGAVLSAALSFRSPIIGASAGVFGVMLAFAYYWPDARILIWGIVPVRARVLVIITTVFALWAGVGGAASGIAHFAHLGGYAGAFAYLRWLERGRAQFRKRAENVGADRLPRGRTPPRVDLSSVHQLNRDEVNRILDKIGEQGVDALTPQERTFLSNFVPPDDRPPPG